MRGLLISLIALAPAIHAAPCIAASSACTEWVSLGNGPARSMIYRTYSIDAAPEAFADLVAGRNARGIIVF